MNLEDDCDADDIERTPEEQREYLCQIAGLSKKVLDHEDEERLFCAEFWGDDCWSE